jgi:hypothetical protein
MRGTRAAAHERGQLEAVHARHVDVENGQRHFVFEQQVQCRRAGIGHQQVDLRPGQRRLKRHDVMRDVVDDQNVDSGIRHGIGSGFTFNKSGQPRKATRHCRGSQNFVCNAALDRGARHFR